MSRVKEMALSPLCPLLRLEPSFASRERLNGLKSQGSWPFSSIRADKIINKGEQRGIANKVRLRTQAKMMMHLFYALVFYALVFYALGPI
jgi:hypothetical protein